MRIRCFGQVIAKELVNSQRGQHDIKIRARGETEAGIRRLRLAGANQVTWDGRDGSGRSVASGTYFARLESGGLTSVMSMVLVR